MIWKVWRMLRKAASSGEPDGDQHAAHLVFKTRDRIMAPFPVVQERHQEHRKAKPCR